MICHISVDAVASSAAKKKPTSPSWRAPFRPKRSPIAPAVNSRPANTNEYPATAHCSWEVVAWRSSDSVGIATVKLELPTVTITRLRQSTPKVHQRRA